jgi:hypothetical protein
MRGRLYLCLFIERHTQTEGEGTKIVQKEKEGERHNTVTALRDMEAQFIIENI